MAITGLTDRSPSCKECGRLRKGAPKSEGLVNLHYFRPDFRPDEPDLMRRFLEVYGAQPARINIRLAFTKVDDNWDAFFTVYNTAGQLGKAGAVPGREGNWWIYLRDNKTGKIVVKDAQPEMRFDPTVPVYSYYSKKYNRDVPVFAKPEGRLRVIIPELRSTNHMLLLTHGWYDIARISEQIAGIKEFAQRIGQTISMVPLVLIRRPEMVSCSIGDKKSMREEWIINIDIQEGWSAAQFKVLDGLLPGADPLPSLPANIGNPEQWIDSDGGEESDDGDDNDYVQPEEDHPEPAPEPVQEPTQSADPAPASARQAFNGKQRPYSPADLYLILGHNAALADKKGETISPDARNILAANLEMCFAGDADAKDARHTLLKFLFNKTSPKDLTDGEALSVKAWLKVRQDTGGEWKPDSMAVREAQSAYREALQAEGQMSMPLDNQPTLFDQSVG